MILKTLDYRQGKEQNNFYEEWNYFDNIENAASYYDEEVKLPVVRCQFRDGSLVTVTIPNVAYLMSDTGKTIDKIVPADVEELGDTEHVYNTLQDAVTQAMQESIS